ncbi:MAG: 50S ribosomal protein L25 [Candidatus Krumholzibacteriota bacterium]|nr:50S ribosomal protein L25 [Candidatus Krumholzibacteriota bacterium]
MQTVALSAQTRAGTGKQVTRKLRNQGLLPATLYGAAGEPLSLQLPMAELERVLRQYEGGNFIVDLVVDEAAPVMTLIRERQTHPVSGKLIHIDFLRVDEHKPITVEIPIHLMGESIGVKDFSGILEHMMRSVEVSCLPADIPDHIEVDISHLNIGDAVHVGDIRQEKVAFLAEEGRVVASVAAPRLIKTAAEVAAEAEAEAAEGEEKRGAEGEGDAGPDS